MEKFKFNGDWEFGMELTELMKSNADWYNSHGQNKSYNAINVKIRDFKSYDPDPLKEQENTLNYLMNNQSKVIDALCKALDKINDDYGERTDMREWFPAKMNPQNLGEVIFVKEILILTDHKEDYAYFGYTCKYKGDDEHGLIVVMHGEELIDYSEDGEMDWYGSLLEYEDFGKDQIHQVIPKYGKFKPWQLEATGEYLNDLLAKKENKILKDLIENGEWDSNFRFGYGNKNLLDLAVTYTNLEMVEYLIQKKVDLSRSMLYCFGEKSKIIRVLVENGANIDTLQLQGVTLLGYEMKNFGSLMRRLSLISDENSDQYKQSLEFINQSKDKISFYLEMGANPENCDGKGNGFKSIMVWAISQEKLKEEVFSTLDEMISNKQN